MSTVIEANSGFPGVENLAIAIAKKGLEPEWRIIYSGRNTLAVTQGENPVCIKAYRVPGLLKGWMYGLLRKPKALRAFKNAVELRRLGFDTPEPVCAVAQTSFGRLGRSYYACRYYCDGWSEMRGVEKRSDFDDFARALASFMHRLHSAGVLMKDFSQGNVLFRRSIGGFEFCLVDINRMDFGVTDRRRLLANFGSPLDTAEGVARVAQYYSQNYDNSAELAARIMEIFEKRQKQLWRKRRFKERFLKKKP